MSKYSLAKKLVTKAPYNIREAGATFFTCLPSAISPRVYTLMRRVLFKDNQNREFVYQSAFEKLLELGSPSPGIL